MEVDASFRLPTMPPPTGTPFRALHPYQFAPAEYNPLMPSPDHPPNATHPPSARSEHGSPSDPLDRNHSSHAYYTHPPPAPAHSSSSRSTYQSSSGSQFRTHAVNWGLPPISSPQQQPQSQQLPPPSQLAGPSMAPAHFPATTSSRRSSDDTQRAPQAAMLYAQSQQLPPIQASQAGIAPATRTRSSSLIATASTFPQGANVPRLPPIMQVEKQQVTTSATQAASASRRRNEANFTCPVPGCGSTFTRRFNLRGTSLASRVCHDARVRNRSFNMSSFSRLASPATCPLSLLDTQDTFAPIRPSARSCASGPGVTRDLRASMIASKSRFPCGTLTPLSTCYLLIDPSLSLRSRCALHLSQTTSGATYVAVAIKRLPGMWEDVQSSRRAKRKSYWHTRVLARSH